MHFCLNFDMKCCSSTLLWSSKSPRVAEVWCFRGALNADGSFGPCHLVLLIARVARVKEMSPLPILKEELGDRTERTLEIKDAQAPGNQSFIFPFF